MKEGIYMFCTNCNYENHNNSLFCINCGTNLGAAPPPVPEATPQVDEPEVYEDVQNAPEPVSADVSQPAQPMEMPNTPPPADIMPPQPGMQYAQPPPTDMQYAPQQLLGDEQPVKSGKLALALTCILFFLMGVAFGAALYFFVL